MTYEIRARYKKCEYTPIDEAADEEAAQKKLEAYRQHFPNTWALWYQKVEGKQVRIRQL